jgi:hypothetical protein
MAGTGGRREGAGRKTKDVENRIRDLSINALSDVFGSEEEAIKHLAQQSKESFPHFKLLLEYGYGKPKETIDLTANIPVVDMSQWK